MQALEMIVRAKPGTAVEGKLSRAEAAGMKAIHREIRRVQHERRQLTLQDQKLQEELQGFIEELEEAWRELCDQHGFDPNVPIDKWTITKKNRATLDANCHPVPNKEQGSSEPGGSHDAGEQGDQQGAAELPSEGDAECGDHRSAHASG